MKQIIVLLTAFLFVTCKKPSYIPLQQIAEYQLNVDAKNETTNVLHWPKCTSKDFEQYKLYLVFKEGNNIDFNNPKHVTLIHQSTLVNDTISIDSSYLTMIDKKYILKLELKERHLISNFVQVPYNMFVAQQFDDIQVLKDTSIIIGVKHTPNNFTITTLNFEKKSVLQSISIGESVKKYCISANYNQYKLFAITSTNQIKEIELFNYTTSFNIPLSSNQLISSITCNQNHVVFTQLSTDSSDLNLYNISSKLIVDKKPIRSDRTVNMCSTKDSIFAVGFLELDKFKIVSNQLQYVTTIKPKSIAISNTFVQMFEDSNAFFVGPVLSFYTNGFLATVNNSQGISSNFKIVPTYDNRMIFKVNEGNISHAFANNGYTNLLLFNKIEQPNAEITSLAVSKQSLYLSATNPILGLSTNRKEGTFITKHALSKFY